MTQQQIVNEFKRFSKTEKSAVIRELLQIFEEDLSDTEKNNGDSKPFQIDALSLEPKIEFDFDNIGKLISETEGDFHK